MYGDPSDCLPAREAKASASRARLIPAIRNSEKQTAVRCCHQGVCSTEFKELCVGSRRRLLALNGSRGTSALRSLSGQQRTSPGKAKIDATGPKAGIDQHLMLQ